MKIRVPKAPKAKKRRAGRHRLQAAPHSPGPAGVASHRGAPRSERSGQYRGRHRLEDRTLEGAKRSRADLDRVTRPKPAPPLKGPYGQRLTPADDRRNRYGGAYFR